ncbi:MAG: hypothetical protein V4722_14855 [Bacteroidota bacterium]
MQTASLKKTVIEIIEAADEALLLQIINLTIEYECEQGPDEFTETEIKWLEDQSEQRRNGTIQTSSWPDVRARIIAGRKAKG